MKMFRFFGLFIGAGLLAWHANAQVPQMINYQGRVAVGGTISAVPASSSLPW